MRMLKFIICVLIVAPITFSMPACAGIEPQITGELSSEEMDATPEEALDQAKADKEEEKSDDQKLEEAIPPPVAKITVNRDKEAGINTSFRFSGIESSCADGRTLTYEWTLWDGKRWHQETDVVFRVVFTEIGEHEIRLIVSDGKDTAEDTVTVSIVEKPPTIVLSENNIVCKSGDILEISAQGTKDQEGNEADITWLLPDGTILEGEEIEYIVSEVGKSKIVVTATDGVNESVEEITITAEESMEYYKESCETVNYDDLLRYPDEYLGKRIYTKAEIVQKLSETEFHVNITEGRYGRYSDRTWLFFETIDFSLIENDIIEVWGLGLGTESYETVMGATNTIPVIYGEYVHLVTKAGDR